MYIDSHCHLNFPELRAQLPEILANMARNQVTHALCVSVNLPDWPAMMETIAPHDNLWASAGVHPAYDDTPEASMAQLLDMAAHPRVIAIGETGLDYYHQEAAPEWQLNRFRQHIRAARQADLPLIIHTRAAAEDTLRLLREEHAEEVGGVMHCFSESWEVAEAAMALGFMISFSGIVTFKNAHVLHDVARRVPLERILIETDAPYLAPVPYRGKLNDPSKVIHVAEKLAELKQVPLATIAEHSTRNFFSLFNKAAASA